MWHLDAVLRQPHIYLSGSMDRTMERGVVGREKVKGCPLLSQWLTFKLFRDYIGLVGKPTFKTSISWFIG